MHKILSLAEAVTRRSSVKKMFLNFLKKFTGKHLCRRLLLKRDFDRGVFQWIFWNSQWHLFNRTFANGYLCTEDHRAYTRVFQVI